MDEDKVARYGLLAGVVFVVLVLVSAFLAGSPPKLSDHDQKIVTFFKDHQDSLKIASYLGGLAGLVFLWFLGSLFGRLRRAEGGSGRLAGVALTGGVVAVAVNFVASGIMGYTALHAAEKTNPSPFLYRLASDLGGYTFFGVAAFVAGVSVLIWSKGVLPKIIGYVGEAIALLVLVGAAGVSTESDTIFTIGFIAFIAFAIWLAVVSVMLYRTPETA
jgi:hypothetical protein